MRYKQLDEEQRYQIYEYRKVGKRQNEIAEVIGVDPSTISRELQRNPFGYPSKCSSQNNMNVF